MRYSPETNDEERVEVLVQAGGVRIERIVSRGHCSPPEYWYDQHEHEWVTVIQGAAELEFREPDGRLEMRPGDHVLIPAHRLHRVAWTAPGEETVWLAVFFSGAPPGSG